MSAEKPEVKTTIVGGRPPGCGKEAGPIPRGIEVLVKKASVDAAFKEVLLKERSASAGRIGLSLKESEAEILNNIPRPHLEGVISATRVSPKMKQVFLGCAATVMLAALTSAAGASEDYDANIRGITPHEITTGKTDTGTVEYLSAPEPYFKKAECDARLKTGKLGVQVTERMGGGPVESIRIHFIKVKAVAASAAGKEEVTEGLGYTDASGVYRIEGVPEGKYSIEAAQGSAYFFQGKEIEIAADTENSVSFQLDRKNAAGILGIQPAE